MQIIEILNCTVSSTVFYLELCLSGLTRMYTENFSAKKILYENNQVYLPYKMCTTIGILEAYYQV